VIFQDRLSNRILCSIGRRSHELRNRVKRASEKFSKNHFGLASRCSRSGNMPSGFARGISTDSILPQGGSGAREEGEGEVRGGIVEASADAFEARAATKEERDSKSSAEAAPRTKNAAQSSSIRLDFSISNPARNLRGF